MAEKHQIYKGEKCGMVIEVLHGAEGQPQCCDGQMKLMEEQTADMTEEKHVPWIQKTDDGIKVTIGKAALHPMEEKHYIEWIELTADGKVYKQYLTPGDAPEAVFPVQARNVSAREFCNVHGLWKGQ